MLEKVLNKVTKVIFVNFTPKHILYVLTEITCEVTPSTHKVYLLAKVFYLFSSKFPCLELCYSQNVRALGIYYSYRICCVF